MNTHFDISQFPPEVCLDQFCKCSQPKTDSVYYKIDKFHVKKTLLIKTSIKELCNLNVVNDICKSSSFG